MRSRLTSVSVTINSVVHTIGLTHKTMPVVTHSTTRPSTHERARGLQRNGLSNMDEESLAARLRYSTLLSNSEEQRSAQSHTTDCNGYTNRFDD
jgi:hypothetical protein